MKDLEALMRNNFRAYVKGKFDRAVKGKEVYLTISYNEAEALVKLIDYQLSGPTTS